MTGWADGDVMVLWFLAAGGLAGAAILSVVYTTLRTGASPMPSNPAMRRAVMDLAAGQPAGTIYELGSGWGGLARGLARRNPHRRVVGIERSPIPYLAAYARQFAGGPANLDLRFGDFRRASLADAGCVICYLGPEATAELAAKLRRELAPGAVVISVVFALSGVPAVERVEAGDRWRSPVYLYRAPLPGIDEVA